MRLRREHVVDEAIALLDADGLDALTRYAIDINVTMLRPSQ